MIKIYVSKKELKKFRVNSSNINIYESLLYSGYCTMPSECLAVEVFKDLDRFGMFYTVRRSAAS